MLFKSRKTKKGAALSEPSLYAVLDIPETGNAALADWLVSSREKETAIASAADLNPKRFKGLLLLQPNLKT